MARGEASAETSPAGDYDRCLAMTRNEPTAALAKAESWRNAGGGFPADHCAAVALVKLKRYVEAAQRLEAMAGAMMRSDPSLRADALEQAGEAWLLADRPSEAKAALDAALAFKHDDPDLLIDRAQTFAEAGNYWDAIDDLNRAIELSPGRADALVFRASAYRRVPDGLDLAQQDIDQALRLAPDDPAGLLERGNIRALKGDLTGAKADWQRVEKLAPRTADAIAARNNITHLSEQADKTTAPPTRR
jgi:tetratricopeptide (TPR) repeat protein